MEKYQQMKAFISVAADYIKHPNENATSDIQRNLGVISASLDLSIFDPSTSVAAEFYVSLYELMNSMGSRSTLIWSTIDVLQNACRNIPARQALIHTYKFAPILARLLEANLTTEKRIRVLKLLQELTYGIKISWQEAHLPYLISTLTQWVAQSKEKEIIAFSLGVLVNLCYKNLPAVYTLVRTINTKEFIRTLLKLKQDQLSTSVPCCKLLIILEPTNTNISEKYIMDFVTTTFVNLRIAMKQKDVLLLRHIVDFFNDVGQNDHSRNVLLTYSNYRKDVEDILAILEEDTDPECVALIMEFILSLVKLKLSALIPLYPIYVKSAMTWVPVEQVCSKALALIRTVIIDSRRTKTSTDVLTELDPSVLMLITKSGDEFNEKENRNAEMEARQAELMQLFQEMIKSPPLKKKIIQSFSEHEMRRLFSPMLNNELSAAGDWTGNFTQNVSISLYIHALVLTADLAANNSNWLTLYSELLSRKQVQMTMALALFTGDGEVKQKVLQLTSSVGFPQDCVVAVALCMKELEPLVLVQSSNNDVLTNVTNKISLNYTGNEMAPLFSIAQEERLDMFLNRLQLAFESKQIADIPTSAVMELYEYKLAAMRHSERAIQSSLEAADNHSTSLQHRVAQVVAESCRLHQLLFDTQQCLEGTKTEKTILTGKLSEMKDQSEKAMLTKKKEIETLKKIMEEKSMNMKQLNEILVQRTTELEASNNKIDVLSKRVQELDNERLIAETKATDMSNKNRELNGVLQKLKDSLSKKEQILEKKKAEIETNQIDISALKQELQQMTQMLHTYEQTISEKEKNIQRMSAELVDFSRMRDMIFELTAKKKDDLNSS